jgi:hypothetical protein
LSNFAAFCSKTTFFINLNFLYGKALELIMLIIHILIDASATQNKKKLFKKDIKFFSAAFCSNNSLFGLDWH